LTERAQASSAPAGSEDSAVRVGHSPPRAEGRDKVTGAARYVDDLHFEGMLHGATIRSTTPHARLLGVDLDPAFDWTGFTVVTAADVPKKNVVTLIEDDQPFLAQDRILHPDEPVALLACADVFRLRAAMNHVTVRCEPLPPVLDLDASAAAGTPLYKDDNCFKRIGIDKGNVDAAFARPDVVIVEGTYTTGAQEQLYIEPQGVVATATPEAGVTVWGSIQCPYYVQKALMPLFGFGPDKVRIIQSVTGGGFGGKEEYPSIIAGHAALLSWKAGGAPVKLIYDRTEDMLATTKRHPSRTHHRTAVTRDGELVAMDIAFDLDGGAYATLSAVVLSRGTIHAAGPYRCPNVRIRSRALATNHPPHGAFRGFGAPQSIFAVERQMDRVAKTLGMDRVELRRKNLLNVGDVTATSQTIEEPIDLQAMVDTALTASDWDAARARFSRENANPSSTIRRGLGLATFFHGSGFTGSGEVYLASVAAVEAWPDGRVEVLAASTEIGQGTNTIFTQIAATALGLPAERIVVAQPDTGRVPNSGPTVASRTVMVVGKLVERASLAIRARLVAAGLLPDGDFGADAFTAAVQAYIATHGPLKESAEYTPPPGIVWDDKAYRGSAYACYGWATYVAQVAVDTRTYEAKVEKFWAIQDIGKVIHPVFAAGQVEGGVAQGVGWALYEEVRYQDGRVRNPQMTNYIMPTAADVPDTEVRFVEVPFSYGPSGAKGVGELPMDGPAPAILSALEDALGVPFDHVPALPETILEAVHGA
jgi:CO/xanthine dehydrogenase Mo-binding subunit